MSRIIKTTFADDGDDRTLGRLADALEAKAPELRKVIGQPEEPDVTPPLDEQAFGEHALEEVVAANAVASGDEEYGPFEADEWLRAGPGDGSIAPVLRGLVRRLTLRGGPGSGHHGHEGRPGRVGGSQSGDFHSAEPGDQFPVIGPQVSGLSVRDDVPNTTSIGATFGTEDQYEVLPGIREVPMSAFDGINGKSYSATENARIAELAEGIEASGEIAPLIVVIDKEGPYILEGSHRIDALYRLGKESFPAMVVLDKTDGGNAEDFHEAETGSYRGTPEAWKNPETRAKLDDIASRLNQDSNINRAGEVRRFLANSVAAHLGRPVSMGHGKVQEFYDSVRQDSPSGLWVRDDTGNVLMVVASDAGAHGWSKTQVALGGIFAAQKGTGLGTAFMEALHDYAQASDKQVLVHSVANPKFFEGFWWLKREDPESTLSYVSKAEDERLTLRGGPGSGHFGHEGRPGKVGGSQPGDFHSAEPGAYGKGIDSAAMEVLTPGLPISPEDAKWLEAWFAKNTTAVDPTQHETLVGPSGKAYAVDGLGGHNSAGESALGALGQKKLDEGGAASEFTVKPIVAEGDWMIETYAEDVGPDGDGWDRDPDGTLTFTFLTIAPGAAAKVPIKYRIEKHGDEYQIITGSSRDAVRPSTLFKFVYNAQEIAGKERHIGLESEDKAKQFVEAMLFGDARQINVDVYPIGGEARSYEFTRLPGEALEAIGLDPEKNIIPDYNWTDNQVPPFVAGTVEEVAEKTGDYFASRRDKSKKPEPYSLNLAMGRITGEDGILAMGFLRVSRGFAGTSGQVPEVGMSWNRTAGLTEAQKRVAVKVARNTVEEGGRFSYERFNGYDLQSQRWGDVQSGYFAEWPDRLFTGVVQGADINDLLSRSFDDLPAWALRLLIQRGGPGSGHFGHEGRPGQVGGSQPGDFHEAAPSIAMPKSVEWHHPESEKASDDFEPILYHGTVREHIEDIARFGLLPQVGEWVTSAYSRPGTNIGKAKVEATYFAGPEGSYGFPESGSNDVQDDSYAWKSIMAIQAQVSFLMDKVPDDVTIEDIRRNGLLVGVKASDLKDADVRVVIESQPEEADEPVPVAVPVSFPDDSTVDVGYDEQELSGVGPERGDYFTTAKVSPSLYLYGDDLVRWMAHFFARHNGGEDMDYDLGADVVSRLGDRYREDLSVDDAVLDDFPADDEEEAVEKSSYRRTGKVVNRTPDRPLPTLRVFIPQWLALRGGPGSGHFGHAGRPGKVGGSAPSDFHSAEGQGPKPGDMVDCPRCGGTGYLEHYQHVAEGVCFQCGGDKKVPYVPPKEMPEPDKKWVAITQRIANAREELAKELYLPKPGEPITNPTLLDIVAPDKREMGKYGPNPKDWPPKLQEEWERYKLEWAFSAAVRDKIFQQFGHETVPYGLAGMFWGKEAKKEKEFMEVFDRDPEGFIEQDIGKARAAFSAKTQRVSGEQAEADAFFQSWKPPENALTAKLATSVTKHGYDWVKGNKLVKLSVPEASRYSLDNSTKILEDIGARPVVEVKKSASGNWWYIVRPLAEGRFAMHQFSQYEWDTEKGPGSEIHEVKRGDWEWKFARPYVLNFIKQNGGG